MPIPRRNQKGRDSRFFVAAEDVSQFAAEVGALLEQAVGITWYERNGTEVDRAALALCRLRRARAGEKGGPEYGDEAVRAALTEASLPALVWLASRAISYMDESGYPEAVEPWFRHDDLLNWTPA